MKTRLIVGTTEFQYRNGDLTDLLKVGCMRRRQLALMSRCVVATGAYIPDHFVSFYESHSKVKQFLISEKQGRIQVASGA